MAPRFFVPPDWLSAERARLEGEAAHRVARVLRLRPGDEVELCDGSGQIFRVELIEVAPERAVGRVLAVERPAAESAVYLTLYQSVIREKRMAWLMEKGTEVGVDRFVPLTTERTVRAKEGQVNATRLSRWERIVREAAEQSRRTRVPLVSHAMTLEEACEECEGIGLFCAAQIEAPPLQLAVRELWRAKAQDVGLFIGPEGGWSPAEIERAIAAELRPVSLGRRVLRAETAGVVATALALATLEDAS
ncbi:MAG: 16S rRNA (uracil(1498)-N(3))-methyltransferase [Anaerolineae bacterium]